MNDAQREGIVSPQSGSVRRVNMYLFIGNPYMYLEVVSFGNGRWDYSTHPMCVACGSGEIQGPP